MTHQIHCAFPTWSRREPVYRYDTLYQQGGGMPARPTATSFSMGDFAHTKQNFWGCPVHLGVGGDSKNGNGDGWGFQWEWTAKHWNAGGRQ